MKKIIIKEASEELNDAVEYYEGEQSGLGLRLKDEVKSYINWILKNPYVARVRKGGYRRVNLKIFPYYIPYIIRNDELWILAIAHNHRRPGYWADRKQQVI